LALEERTRERVPLDWAASVGNQGGALMLIADRNNVAAGAEEAAYEGRKAHPRKTAR